MIPGSDLVVVGAGAAGLFACLFSASMKRFRILAWMFVVTFILFLLGRGRYYYTGPSYVMLLAAGAAWLEDWLATRTQTVRRVGLSFLWGLQVIGGIVYILAGKPVAKTTATAFGCSIKRA